MSFFLNKINLIFCFLVIISMSGCKSEYAFLGGGSDPMKLDSPILEYDVTDNHIVYSWDYVSGATSYTIIYSEYSSSQPTSSIKSSGIRSSRVVIDGITSNYYISEDVKPGKLYISEVIANNEYTESEPSNEVKVKPFFAHANDTGIEICLDNNSVAPILDTCNVKSEGQDGYTGRDKSEASDLIKKIGSGSKGFDFSKVDIDGNILDNDATEWSCVIDNVTGLMWEIKEPKSQGTLRDANSTYSWYNSDNSTNGGNAGLKNSGQCSKSLCDTESFVNNVNNLALCGKSNWRIPTITELNSIADNGLHSGPYIDIVIFKNESDSGDSYWSSSSDAYSNDYAWTHSFYNNFTGTVKKDDVNHIRLVRGHL
jgi:hypothetical protein